MVQTTSLRALEPDEERVARVEPVNEPPEKNTTVDEELFRNLFNETYRPLVAYARRRVRDYNEADDVVSESFTVAWRRRSELDPESNPLPWLYGIAANVIRNLARSQSRRLRLVDQLEHQPQGSSTVDDPSERPGSDIRSALAALATDDQEVLRLSAWEGLSHAEIGEVIGCSENAVGIRMHRARKRLDQELTKQANVERTSRTQEEDQR